jgi:hypothetical protein
LALNSRQEFLLAQRYLNACSRCVFGASRE